VQDCFVLLGLQHEAWLRLHERSEAYVPGIERFDAIEEWWDVGWSHVLSDPVVEAVCVERSRTLHADSLFVQVVESFHQCVCERRLAR